MHVALLAPDLSGTSGWSRYARDLAAALHARHHKISTIVHKRSDVSFTDGYTILASPTGYLSGRLRPWVTAFRLQMFLKKLKPDIVHVIAEPYGLPLSLVKEKGWKNVLTIHGTYAVSMLESSGTRTLAERMYGGMDGIISVSAFTKRYVHERHPDVYEACDLDRKITVIPNAVDLSDVPVPQQRKHSQEPFRILSIGAVKERKGYLQAVRACAAFRKRTGKTCSYDIIGSLTDEPAYVERLRDEVRVLGLERDVTLRGSVHEEALRAALGSANLLLQTSLQSGPYVEGFGLVFLEANAWGVPVIGPNTGGCPEAIRDGITGFVRNPDDADGIAQAMEEILLRETIDPHACRRWAEDHSTERFVEEVEKFYATLSGSGSA